MFKEFEGFWPPQSRSQSWASASYRPGVERGLAEYRQQRTQRLEPLQNRLTIVEDLETENREKYNRLLNAYLNSDFPEDILDEQKQPVETAMKNLRKERAALEAELHQDELTDDDIENSEEFAT